MNFVTLVNIFRKEIIMLKFIIGLFVGFYCGILLIALVSANGGDDDE